MSGARPNPSQISNAAVFCPSMRAGLTLLTTPTCPVLPNSRTMRRASSKLPSTAMVVAPYISACASLPRVILPCGNRTTHFICASTGNTSASAAAYAARAQMKCVVLLPHGKIALGKLAQALMHGAVTVAVEGNFDAALRIVRELVATGEVEVVTSINPAAIEG